MCLKINWRKNSEQMFNRNRSTHESFKNEHLKSLIVSDPFRATYRLKVSFLRSVPVTMSTRELGPTPCCDNFFLECLHISNKIAGSVLMMIFNPKYPKIMTTYITEYHCMEYKLVTRTERWARMLATPTAHFLCKPG